MAGTLTYERHFNFRLFLDDFIKAEEPNTPGVSLPAAPAPLSTKGGSRRSSETAADSDFDVLSDAEKVASESTSPTKKSVFSLASFAPKRSLGAISDMTSLASMHLGVIRVTCADLSEAVEDTPIQSLRRKLAAMLDDKREFAQN